AKHRRATESLHREPPGFRSQGKTHAIVLKERHDMFCKLVPRLCHAKCTPGAISQTVRAGFVHDERTPCAERLANDLQRRPGIGAADLRPCMNDEQSESAPACCIDSRNP